MRWLAGPAGIEPGNAQKVRNVTIQSTGQKRDVCDRSGQVWDRSGWRFPSRVVTWGYPTQRAAVTSREVRKPKGQEELGQLSIVSRTVDEPVGMRRRGSRSATGAHRAVTDRLPQEESLLRTVCRSLEAAGLSVVVIVALDASAGSQPNPLSMVRPRRVQQASGLSVVGGGADKDASTVQDGCGAGADLTGEVPSYADADRVIGSDLEAQAPVIVLTSAQDEDAARAAVAAGGFGYMVKAEGLVPGAGLSMLVGTGQRGLEGDPTGPRGDVAEALSPTHGLTSREVEVLRALANGASTTEVAREFFVSPKTVKNHLAHIYAKLGVVSRTQAVAKAVKNGIVKIV